MTKIYLDAATARLAGSDHVELGDSIRASVDADGNLVFRADEAGRNLLRQAMANAGYDDAFKLMTVAARAIKVELIQPEDVGALTSSPMFASKVERTGRGGPPVRIDGSVWWFPDYAVVNEVEELIEAGEVTFAAGAMETEPVPGGP